MGKELLRTLLIFIILFLNAIPGMASSIKEAMDAPNSEFSEDVEW